VDKHLQDLLTESEQDLAAGRYAEALQKLSEVLDLRPGDERAMTLQRQAKLARLPAPLDCTRAGGVSKEEVRRAQEAWAKYLGRPVEETVKIAEGVTMTFVLIPPGKFRMGSPQNEKDRSWDEAPHEVTLTKPFYLAKTEVTQAQYRALTKANPSEFKGDDQPVERVSWEQAWAFAVKLTKERGDKHAYRLPTEAEWEYACRGGRPSYQPFGIGNGRALSSFAANFDGRYPYGGGDRGPFLQSTCGVGSYAANALGLHDMHGNVWEWCADCYGPYPAGAVTDPAGPEHGWARVIRGGCWAYLGASCRAALRNKYAPSFRTNDLGFRLAYSVPSADR
jgi:formylglycine-generating enzyme required for sulfatase activity